MAIAAQTGNENGRTQESSNIGSLVTGALLVATLYSAATVWFTATESHFIGDDLYSDWLGRTRPFLQFALTPIDVHPVPLHRAVAYLVNHAFPLDFRVATTILVCFHVAGVLALAAALRRLLPSPFGAVFVALYCISPFVGPLFWWWTAGLHRFPYIAAMLIASVFYLRFRERGLARNAVGVGLSMLVGLGFFPKAALLPLYLAGLEFALGARATDGWVNKRLALLAGLCALSTTYIAVWSLWVSEGHQPFNRDLGFHLRFLFLSWQVFLRGWVGVFWNDSVTPTVLAAAAWSLFIGYTVRKQPRNVLTWGIWVALVTVNFMVTSIPKQRTDTFGLLIPTRSERYYFELCFLTVLFSAVALHHALAGRGISRPSRQPWLSTGSVVAALGILGLVAHDRTVDHFNRTFSNLKQAHDYLERFRKDLKRAEDNWDRTMPFQNGWMPQYFGPKGQYRTHGGLLLISGANAEIVSPKKRRLRIRRDGAIVVAKKRRRARKARERRRRRRAAARRKARQQQRATGERTRTAKGVPVASSGSASP